MQKKSTFNVGNWERERKKQEKLLDKMCYHKHIFKADGIKQKGMQIQQPPMRLN